MRNRKCEGDMAGYGLVRVRRVDICRFENIGLFNIDDKSVSMAECTFASENIYRHSPIFNPLHLNEINDQ